jgi:probable HAF family extracellular repeat protein
VIPLYWATPINSPTALASLGDPARPSGINAGGQIVGYSSVGTNGPVHALMWENGASPALDLNTLLPANSPWVLQFANAINDSGEIVGTGTYGGEARAFALIPLVWAPRITSIAGSGNDLQLSFTSRAGHTYNVLGTADLASGTWDILQTGIPGNGGIVQVTVSNAFSQPAQFFRFQEGP